MMAVLGVEADVVDEIDTAANHVARRERRPIRLARSRRAERVAVVSVVAVRLLVPTCTVSTRAYSLCSTLISC